MRFAKQLINQALRRLGYCVMPLPAVISGKPAADRNLYQPLFSPWRGLLPFARYYNAAAPHTLVSPDRCWVLYSLGRQCLSLEGDFWECGVYKGGTARLLAQVIEDADAASKRRLHLFDSFQGMPATDEDRDLHRQGDFADTSLKGVQSAVGHDHLVDYHEGFIPATFRGLEKATIAFAHIDVDLYQAVKDCCEFVFPRLLVGGVMVFDDYGFPTCLGARHAVDEFFAATSYVPLILPTGQAVVFKHQ